MTLLRRFATEAAREKARLFAEELVSGAAEMHTRSVAALVKELLAENSLVEAVARIE